MVLLPALNSRQQQSQWQSSSNTHRQNLNHNNNNNNSNAPLQQHEVLLNNTYDKNQKQRYIQQIINGPAVHQHTDINNNKHTSSTSSLTLPSELSSLLAPSAYHRLHDSIQSLIHNTL